MKVWNRVIVGAVIIACAVLFFRTLVGGSTVALFSPAGPVAGAQKNIIILSVLLMLVIVVPMFIVLFTVAWKYRADNTKARYEPDRIGGVGRELLLWAIPAVLIAVLGVLNWKSAHALDPSLEVASASGAAPLTVEVVALPWKWLFIYPAQNIATVNYLEFPEQTPVHFELTADAPMSSFWIPQLGSQIYAMAAMMTQLNLEASTTGDYVGKDTEINGAGYAGMTFDAKSVSADDFNAWVASVQAGSSTLDMDAYNVLLAPSTYNPPAYYASVESDLFDSIMMKFMMPTSTTSSMMTGTGTEVNTSSPMQMATGSDMQAMPGMEM